MTKGILSYVIMGLTIVAVGTVANLTHGHIEHLIERSTAPHVLATMLPIGVILLMSYVSSYLAHQRPVPSFVLALLLGQAVKPFLHEIVANPIGLEVVVTLCATLILAQGGLETPLANFKRLFPKIFMLAFPGVLITAFMMAWAVYLMAGPLGAMVTVTTAILLGAILASTDPAAVIPLFKPLRFRDESVKDIAVAESAVNDVVGSLLLLAFLGMLSALGSTFTSIGQGFSGLFTASSASFLAKQIFVGTVVGIGGYFLLRLFRYGQQRKELTSGASGAFLLSVPVACFFVAPLWGGSGYLAAFVAGLLFHVSADMHDHVEDYGEVFIDGFAKPTIFLLLGAMIDLSMLAQYLWIGLIVAVAFVFIIRPVMVFLMLAPFAGRGHNRMSLNQLLFLSWIRETGAIPAVLLVTVVGRSIPGTEPLLPIGMIVILFTLLVQPPLTPWLARKLGMTDERRMTEEAPAIATVGYNL